MMGNCICNFCDALFMMGVRGELATDYNFTILFSPFPECMNLFEPGRVVGAKDAIESKKIEFIASTMILHRQKLFGQCPN